MLRPPEWPVATDTDTARGGGKRTVACTRGADVAVTSCNRRIGERGRGGDEICYSRVLLPTELRRETSSLPSPLPLPLVQRPQARKATSGTVRWGDLAPSPKHDWAASGATADTDGTVWRPLPPPRAPARWSRPVLLGWLAGSEQTRPLAGRHRQRLGSWRRTRGGGAFCRAPATD